MSVEESSYVSCSSNIRVKVRYGSFNISISECAETEMWRIKVCPLALEPQTLNRFNTPLVYQ